MLALLHYLCADVPVVLILLFSLELRLEFFPILKIIGVNEQLLLMGTPGAVSLGILQLLHTVDVNVVLLGAKGVLVVDGERVCLVVRVIRFLLVEYAARAELRIRPSERDQLAFLPIVDLLLRLRRLLCHWPLALVRVLHQVLLLLALITDDVGSVALVLEYIVLRVLCPAPLVPNIVGVNDKVGVVDGNDLFWEESLFGYQLG